MISLFLRFVNTSAQILFAEFARRHTGFALESTAEIAFIRKAAKVYYLFYALVCRAQQALCRRQTAAEKIFDRGISCHIFEDVR